MENLSEKQKEVCIFIDTYIKKYNYSPSVRDISSFFKKSVGTIYPMLKRLKRKSIIDFEEGKARTIKIINDIS
jgi:repressor LexA